MSDLLGDAIRSLDSIERETQKLRGVLASIIMHMADPDLAIREVMASDEAMASFGRSNNPLAVPCAQHDFAPPVAHICALDEPDA